MRRLGCLTPFGIGAGLVALAGVALAALLTGGAMFSPGPLNAQASPAVTLGGISAHADLGGNCAACHASPLDTAGMDARCLDCHTDVQGERADPTTIHGLIPADQSCRTCHTEHRGSAASLTSATLPAFDHAALGFALAAHQTTAAGRPFACADCHPGLAETPHPSGAYGFNASLCRDCHADYQADFVTRHVADVGADCQACHDGVDRYSGFDHQTLKLPLDGKHAAATCASCHGQARDPAAFTGLDATCISCHQADDVHNGAYGSDCASCHSAAGWQPATFDHSRSAFPLTGAHLTADCTSCHGNHIYRGTPTNCVDCHAEPQAHLGQFGTDCNACHSTSRWTPAFFEHSAFPINHGTRGTNACTTCHTMPNNYKTYTCYGCHAHTEANVIAEHRGENLASLNDCVRCHSGGRGGDD